MVMRTPRTPPVSAREGLEKLATYPFQILTFVEADGYPVSVALEAKIDPVRRGETLSREEFVALARAWMRRKSA